MFVVNLFSSQASSSANLPANPMPEIQALEKAVTDCNWSHARELAQSFIDSDRQHTFKQIKNTNINLIPATENLLKVLAASSLQWEDNTRHILARAARLLVELTCMKVVNEGKELASETQSIKVRIKMLLDGLREDQVGLRYELTCSLEALKIFAQPEAWEFLPKLVETLVDTSLCSQCNLESLIPSLPKKMKEWWYVDALYIACAGHLTRSNWTLFESQTKVLGQHFDILEIAQTAVEFFGDLIRHGSPEISYSALVGIPGLITLANQQAPKISMVNFSQTTWPVRYRAIQILSTLINHHESKFRKAASEALFRCSLRETHFKVRPLFDELEKYPEIRHEWKELLTRNSGKILEQNVREIQELGRLEQFLAVREKRMSQNSTNPQLQSQEKAGIELQRRFINLIRQDTLSHKMNAEAMEAKMLQRIKRPLEKSTVVSNPKRQRLHSTHEASEKVNEKKKKCRTEQG